VIDRQRRKQPVFPALCLGNRAVNETATMPLG